MTRDQHEDRLRSEPSTRSTRVMANRARAQQERADMARDFRERLTREVVVDGSAAQSALIDAAVSAYVEIAVVSARFLRCSATADQMRCLSLARGALTRALRLLGAVPRRQVGSDAPPAGASLEERQAWSKRYVERVLAEGSER